MFWLDLTLSINEQWDNDPPPPPVFMKGHTLPSEKHPWCLLAGSPLEQASDNWAGVILGSQVS